ncbi:unnamed protein product [Orchesella dallaii]|uniref:GDP-Man:Man(3)GlcNAc(2)-PP-Dol alpha-1,2-mannosyltransferase n=1 Tax=Orchesella dallaii TaxID=48710 RepID=A0ABP1PUT9_9HEXA
MLLFILLVTGILWVTSLGLIFLFLKQRIRKWKALQNGLEDRVSIGLFHPFCNSGSGRERVLWVALKCLQTRYPDSQFVVYTGDTNASPEEVFASIKDRFNIVLPDSIELVYLHKRKWVEPINYRVFTLLGQSLGSIYLGLEALMKFVPDVYIDTSGYAFTLPLFKYLGNCRVGCYVHCPTITTDMLHRVSLYRSEQPYFHQQLRSTSSSNKFITSTIRVFYNRFFSHLYRWAGNCSDIVMVNSSWTEEQIHQIWQCPSKTYKVFPPCDVQEFKSVSKKEDNDENASIKIVSVAPFRPEKDHPLQIRTMYQLREILREDEWNRIRLVIVGSCRDQEDAARVQDMEDLCKHLSVEENVQFRVNISYDDLKHELSDALIGMHTTWNEQFGVVESMSAGLIMVANRSGGPLMDIIMEYDGSRNGFLATDENDYAEAIRTIILMTPESREVIREQATASVDRFSERQFTKSLLEAVESLLR